MRNSLNTRKICYRKSSSFFSRGFRVLTILVLQVWWGKW